jgi:dihydroorotate dehydrogenase electron transfer subunit
MDAGCSNHDLAGFVPAASECQGEVVQNRCVARDTWIMRLACPEIARQITPGQFFMVRDLRVTDPMLGRPFALLDVWQDSNGQIAGVDFGYVVVGKMTNLMTTWRVGDPCSLWGPLGNGFPAPNVDRLCLVAGGIGVTPFLAVTYEALGKRIYGTPGREVSSRSRSVSLCYGVRSKEHLACVDQFEESGAKVLISTDDGSFGRSGFVTDTLRDQIAGDTPPECIYCCGPEPMLHSVGRIAAENGIPCWLSLETPMACGFGICFSCVTRVRMDDGSTDYRRTCVEGPVFPAEKLCFS